MNFEIAVPKRWFRRSPLAPFIAAFALLGMAAIAVVYALDFNNPPIRSDGLGYYLYLPATFLYHDLSLQKIAGVFNSGAIHDAPPALWHYSGPLLWEDSKNYLIKYTAGEAVLMAPFFVAACLVSLVAGSPLDGFSPIFQYSAALSGLFYAVAGILVLCQVLGRDFRQNTILIAMVAVVFGTDFFHYATYDSLFSHVYSFFLFSAFLYAVGRIYAPCGTSDALSGRETKTGVPLMAGGETRAPFLLAGLIGGLIVITRPTNGLWLLFGLLYGVDSWRSLRERFDFLKEHDADVALAAIPFALALSIQLGYWRVVTGHFLVFSYQGEHFNFTNPQIFNVLFSVRKGLFFWAPILLLLFPGLFYVKKRVPQYLMPMLLFLPLNLYVISSWHSWFYGGSFGHRAFIESFPVFAISFCSLYESCSEIWRRSLRVFTACCVSLSSWLMVKYWTGVIPYDETEWDYFVDTFFTLTLW